MKRNIIYYVINAIAIIFSILLINYNNFSDINLTLVKWGIIGLLLLILHFVKFLRIYFILLEEPISLNEMLKTYIKTTFVSIVLPFKIGELYKMYSYGYKCKNYKKGIIAILFDKLFDAIILCSILIPSGLYLHQRISSVLWLLLIFLIIIITIYYSFSGTYYYLNRYLIKKKDKKTILYLEILEKMNNVYLMIKEMCKERKIVLLMLSALSWFLEGIFVYFVSKNINEWQGINTISKYINDAFFGISNTLFSKYIFFCTLILFLLLVITYGIKYYKIIKIKFRRLKNE